MKEALNKRAKLFGGSANSLHPQCKCRHLPIACILMAFLLPLVLGSSLHTGQSQTPQDLMGPCLHHTHHFPLSLCRPCFCFHREAGRDVYIPLLGTTSAASDSLPLTEAQAPVSSSQTEYPTTSENYHIPHPSWTVAHQAPLSMEFSRKEHWSGLPFPSQGIFPTQASNPSPPHCRQTLYHLSHQESPRGAAPSF